MNKIINSQIKENKKSAKGRTFFGGKDGFDYIMFNNDGKIVASGNLEKLIGWANRDNCAVAILIPVQFRK